MRARQRANSKEAFEPYFGAYLVFHLKRFGFNQPRAVAAVNGAFETFCESVAGVEANRYRRHWRTFKR
jgi:hypothetical protein